MFIRIAAKNSLIFINNVSESEALTLVGDYLKDLGSIQYAQEIYKKKGDFKSVVRLYVEAQEWKDAFMLVNKYPEFKARFLINRLTTHICIKAFF